MTPSPKRAAVLVFFLCDEMFFSVYTHTHHITSRCSCLTRLHIYIYIQISYFFLCVCGWVGCIFLGSSYVCVSYHSVRPWNKVSHSLASRLFSPCRVCCVAGPYSFSCTSSRRDIYLFFFSPLSSALLGPRLLRRHRCAVPSLVPPPPASSFCLPTRCLLLPSSLSLSLCHLVRLFVCVC